MIVIFQLSSTWFSSFLQLTYFWVFLIMSFLNLKSLQKNAYSTAVSWHFCLSTRLQLPSTYRRFLFVEWLLFFSYVLLNLQDFNNLLTFKFPQKNFTSANYRVGCLSFDISAHQFAYSYPQLMEDFCLLDDRYFSVIFCLIFKFFATYLLLSFLNHEFPQSQVSSKERLFNCCFLTFLPLNSLTVTLDYGRFLFIEWLSFFSYVLLNPQNSNNLLTFKFSSTQGFPQLKFFSKELSPNFQPII
jgi:hypothetical protein